MKFLARSNKKKKSDNEAVEKVDTANQAVVRDMSKSMLVRFFGWTKKTLHRKPVWITLAVLIIVGLAGGIYYLTLDKPIAVSSPNETVNLKTLNVEAEKTIIETRRDKTAALPSASASTEDKKVYYTDKIWLMVKDGRQTEIAKYYVEEVKPQEIVFDVDINETLVRSLMMSEYKEEARPVIAQVIASYKVNNSASDPTMKKYIDEKIAYYEGLEASW